MNAATSPMMPPREPVARIAIPPSPMPITVSARTPMSAGPAMMP